MEADPHNPHKSFTVKSKQIRSSAPRLVAQSTINGKYRIIDCLGQGGMSTVYKAEDLGLGRLVAVKVLLSQGMDASSYLRFKQEARAIANLDHPGIVKVFELGEMENREPYIAMEFVQGEPLSDVLAVSALPVSRAVAVVSQACAALNHAHEHGVIHRDIKPSNIMLVKDRHGNEVVKIVDFGIAKLVDTRGQGGSLTQTGDVFGSPMYMSPEQCVGRKLDGRSDIYSLGCVLYEAISGAPPFNATNTGLLLVQHVNEQAVPLKKKIAAIPKRLDQIVQKSLEKDPANRYQTMSEFQDALSGFDDPHSKSQAQESETNLLPMKLIGAVLIGLIIMSMIAYQTFFGKRSGDSASTGSAASNTAEHQSTASTQPVSPGSGQPLSADKWRYDLDNARILRNHGNNLEAIPLLERAAAEAMIAHADPAEQADINRDLGHSYWATSKFTSAIDHYQQALSLYRSCNNVKAAAFMLHCLGSCARNQEHWNEAGSYYTQAMNAYSKATGSRSTEVANEAYQAGIAATQMGDFALAEKYLRHSIEITDHPVLGKHAGYLIKPMEQLAVVLDNEKKYAESAQLYERLSVLAYMHYKSHKGQYAAQYLDSAAMVLEKSGDTTKAQQLAKQSAKFRQEK